MIDYKTTRGELSPQYYQKLSLKGNFYIRYLQSDIGVIIITLNGDDIY